MNSKFLLIIAGVLVAVGIFKPNLNNFIPSTPNNLSVVVVDKPSDPELLEAAQTVIKALSIDPDRRTDGKRLAELYRDLSVLVELDGENTVVKNTEEISQANAISGLLLQLDIKGKYPALSEAAKALMVKAIGDDVIELDDTLRNKAVQGFRALSWACLEGSK